MSDENARAREDAIAKYKVLGGVQLILGAALLICGIFGAVETGKDDDEGSTSGAMPYFLGGFTVGGLFLFSAFMSGCVVYKGDKGHDTDVKKREIGCCMHGQYILAMVSIMFCFMGLVFAGIFGVNYDTLNSESDDTSNEETHQKIAYALIAMLVLALIVIFFTMYLVCSNGKLFGIVLQRGRARGVAVIIDADTASRLRTMNNMNSMNTDSNATALQVEQLRTQNLLLQQQVLQQQQQQQQQQMGFGGQYPPPPPSYSSAVEPAYPPNPSFPSAPPFGKS